MSYYTANVLLDSVKRGAAVPSSQIRLTDADMLALADEEIQTRLLPMLVLLRSEYLVTVKSEPIVSGQSTYDIPYRAVGRTIRDLKIRDGNESYSLPLIALEDTEFAQRGFYFQGDKIKLIGNPTGTLEIHYEVAPSRLALTEDCALISTVASGSVVVSAVPASISTGVGVDLVQAKQGHSIISMDATVTNVSGTTLTVATPTGLVAGDYVCPAGTSPFVMLPPEMFQVLAQAVQVRVLESIGDFEAMQLQKQRLEEKLIAVRALLTPRVRGERQAIISRNGVLASRNNRSARRWL